MMLLAFILSLCSEADAFIGASLLSSFGTAPVLAFLLIGPMVDIKNLMMMVNSFKPRFIVQFITVSVGMIIIYCLLVGVIDDSILILAGYFELIQCIFKSLGNWINTSILTMLI